MSVLIYGKNSCQEIIDINKKILKAYIMEGTNKDFLNILKRKNIDIVLYEKVEFKRQFQGNNQGIVFEVEDYKTYEFDNFINTLNLEENPLIIMLDGITDVHNFGAIIRTCEAGGVAGIIIPKNRSVKISGAAAKTSSGAIEHIKIVEVTNLRNSLEKLRDLGFWNIGTSLDADKDYSEIFVDRPLCVVIGSEGKGMSRLLKETVDFNVKINMIGKVNSLNASVSAGIIVFDILRKRKNL
ncbi:MAG: 23S rRNA (guanosine(2251)-2'-O)-methyltransferase RlmB [Tenericutes bacterium HGW-Tenericutes-5]|jgi:23S rRNA (guanosine2251-2'-O)-methyltransferase|nr:MAG: 23S rRNA (guanosine(2251)-2'-O)-methyltransferase RlmB [Tenericutes bacterium HGW-Tenericutes-5]